MSATETQGKRGQRRRMASVAPHDHSHCEGHGGHRSGLNLTPGRRAILDMLCAAGKPLGAYEMIDLLVDANGRRPAPISVYRALDYLVEHGLVHRLATRNAFLACGHGHGEADPLVFLICEGCGKVEEASSPSISTQLDALAAVSGFRRRSEMIEVSGVCAGCARPD